MEFRGARILFARSAFLPGDIAQFAAVNLRFLQFLPPFPVAAPTPPPRRVPSPARALELGRRQIEDRQWPRNRA